MRHSCRATAGLSAGQSQPAGIHCCCSVCRAQQGCDSQHLFALPASLIPVGLELKNNTCAPSCRNWVSSWRRWPARHDPSCSRPLQTYAHPLMKRQPAAAAREALATPYQGCRTCVGAGMAACRPMAEAGEPPIWNLMSRAAAGSGGSTAWTRWEPLAARSACSSSSPSCTWDQKKGCRTGSNSLPDCHHHHQQASCNLAPSC